MSDKLVKWEQVEDAWLCEPDFMQIELDRGDISG